MKVCLKETLIRVSHNGKSLRFVAYRDPGVRRAKGLGKFKAPGKSVFIQLTAEIKPDEEPPVNGNQRHRNQGENGGIRSAEVSGSFREFPGVSAMCLIFLYSPGTYVSGCKFQFGKRVVVTKAFATRHHSFVAPILYTDSEAALRIGSNPLHPPR